MVFCLFSRFILASHGSISKTLFSMLTGTLLNASSEGASVEKRIVIFVIDAGLRKPQ